MKFIISLLLRIILVSTVTGGLFQGYVALKEIITKHISSGQKKKWFIVLTCFIIAGASLYGVYNPSDSSSPTPSPTSILKPTIAFSSPTPDATATSTPILSGYSAAKPGPSCDTKGGIWTAQGVNNITCSTWVSNITTESWGYLYLQLPNNAAFAANNEISVTLSNIDSLNNSCFGLAEQGDNAGYLVAYCVNGAWTIYSISKQGVVIQTLSSSSTAIRSNTTLSLVLVNNTLKFAIDAESHQVSISPIQPTNVAIAFYNNGCGNCTAATTNFNYITPAS